MAFLCLIGIKWLRSISMMKSGPGLSAYEKWARSISMMIIIFNAIIKVG